MRLRPPPSGRSVLGGLLLLLAVGLLVASLFVGWYEISATASDPALGSSVSYGATETFYPTNQFSVSISCSGSPSCPMTTTLTEPYSQYPTGGPGTLYAAVFAAVVSAIFLAGAAGTLAFVGHRHSRLPFLVAVLAILLGGVLAPMALAVGQTSLVDKGSVLPTNGSTPGSTFFGSCSGPSCGTATAGTSVAASWGPAAGWYLSLGAAVPLLFGMLEARRAVRLR